MNRESISMKAYLADIRKYKIPTQNELREWIIEYRKNNSIIVRDRIIQSQLRLVLSIASKFEKQWSIEDLISEGNIAIMTALKDFDLNKNYKFTTFCSLRIKSMILEFLEFNKDLIYVSEYNKKKFEHLVKVNIMECDKNNEEEDTKMITWETLFIKENNIDNDSLNNDINRLLNNNERLFLEDCFGLKNKTELLNTEVIRKYKLTDSMYNKKRTIIMTKLKVKKDLFLKYLNN